MSGDRRDLFGPEYRAEMRANAGLFQMAVPAYLSAGLLGLGMVMNYVSTYLAIVLLVLIILAGFPAAITATALKSAPLTAFPPRNARVALVVSIAAFVAACILASLTAVVLGTPEQVLFWLALLGLAGLPPLTVSARRLVRRHR